MSYRYVVLGAGTQGVAIAYDLARFGNAKSVVLADFDQQKAFMGAARVNALICNVMCVTHCTIDVSNKHHLAHLLEGVDAVASAISFKYNEAITDAAIVAGAHMIDLGGNTDVVRAQHTRDARARAAGVSVIPDCGMGPGFNLSLAHSALLELEEPESVVIYCGGLPEHPEGELKYGLCFSMGGLVKEYSGFADVLERGKIKKRAALSGVKTIVDNFRFGPLEAAYTSGGLSTAPWTFKKMFPTLQNLSYKTLRWPGHWKLLRKFQKAGRLQEELEARLGTTPREFPDLGIIFVSATGRNKNGSTFASRMVMDRFDAATSFTAMQRLTGFHASIMTILATKGEIRRGVVPVESIDGNVVIAEMEKRGIITTRA